MKRLKECLRLFLIMSKIGLFTFGGGYVMISLLEDEFVSKRKWVDKSEFVDLVAISESTPGPIAINCSTFIGFKRAGVLGSIFATVGVCFPSVVIISLISLFFDAFLPLTIVKYAFRGIQACVVYLIIKAGIKLFSTIEKKPLEMILFGLTIAVMLAFSVLSIAFSSVFYILIGGAVGVIAYLAKRIAERAKEGGK